MKFNELNCLEVSTELFILGKQNSLIVLLGLYSTSVFAAFTLPWKHDAEKDALIFTQTQELL